MVLSQTPKNRVSEVKKPSFIYFNEGRRPSCCLAATIPMLT